MIGRKSFRNKFGGKMSHDKVEMNNLIREIQRLGFLQEGYPDNDSFKDLRYIYEIKLDNRFSVTLEVKSTYGLINFVDRQEQETYSIKYSLITNNILHSSRNTSERYGMSYNYDSDEIIFMISDRISKLDEKEIYRNKMINTFKTALDRMIPEILINGHMGARFRMTHLKMDDIEKVQFNKETDEYRHIRNKWELKELQRKIIDLSENKKNLQFIPEVSILNEMGYTSLEELRKDLINSDYFVKKNTSIYKVFNCNMKLFIDNEKLFLETEFI